MTISLSSPLNVVAYSFDLIGYFICNRSQYQRYAGKLHVRVCAGGARQLASLPRLRRREFHNVPRRIRYKCFKYKDNSGKGRGGCTPACTPENRRGGTWEDVGGLKVGGPSRRTAQLDGAGCGLVDLTDIGAFGIKGRIWFWRQPVTKAVRFKVGLFFKKRPTEP